MTKSKTKAERKWLSIIAQLPCQVCGAEPAQIHHIRYGQGTSQRASHFLTVPICYDCHQGPGGIHVDRSLWRVRKMGEMDALSNTIKTLAELLT